VIVPCAHCGGDGEIVREQGVDRTTGAVMEMIERCPACDGTGCEWIEGEPLDEADLDAALPFETGGAG
jgi:DnaJ-class molecular chaperone